ncbi:unnamed protein product [Spodoptera littoralis]|uniref:SAM domain-containing protein n=1 Tax=Spodoptera littoralis TaxID=7109 RepID=A0A9P0IA29_SPOLI|nr:unnamed protein product [Spodoptera littoralis]CAH1643028.1 unnamed protein product [Spodoptera littoralis]
MQQPMNQAEPIGGQQAMQQQMVLCPVRFVYETQVLVQPGDQIQPNQTFFINPQNPPPWMNRPAPNPVVYVQQLPNNVVHQVPPQIDQNQLYLQQNFANFQLQQHMLAQNHQQNNQGMQLANIVPNMVQTVQPSIQPNDRNITATPNPVQMQTNTQMIQNQMNVQRQVQNQPQAADVQRQVYMNVRPQINQQMNIARPVMSLNQIQNMQAMANMQNLQIQQANAGQTFVQNIGQRMPQNVNAVRPQIMGNNMMNVQNVQTIPNVQQNVQSVQNVQNLQNIQNITMKPPQPPSEANKVMNNVGTAPPAVRNFAQNYNCRPIQPRRRFESPNVPKMQPQPNIPVQQQPLHIPVQPPPPPTQYNQERVNSHTVVTNIATNTNFLNNPNVSRKRKSESPDEIEHKMAPQPPPKPIYKNVQQGITITKICNEIGTNTSPQHSKTNANNVKLNSTVVQMTPAPQLMVVEAPETSDANKKIINDSRTVIAPVTESDKLIRNTVFTQARGRVLQDKINDALPTQIVENKTPESVQNATDIRTDNEVQTDKDAVMTEPPVDKVQPEKAATIPMTETQKVDVNIATEKKVIEVKNDVSKDVVKREEENKSPDIQDGKLVIDESKDQSTEVKDEKMDIAERYPQKQDILTHVVDGYVIQESNFAFPIRKPLIEKTLHANLKAESEATDALKECMKEEMKNPEVDGQLLPFHYLLLHCEKKKEEEDKEDVKEMNPFADLEHTTVKSWTVEDLSSHLMKYDWKDTVSVFQDHEIDGESLFLVSKNQLVSIGVTEENADVICAFVRS